MLIVILFLTLQSESIIINQIIIMKVKSLLLALVMPILFSTSAFAGLPTVDFGNIAGTVGIVTQGSTSIQQGIKIITNGGEQKLI